MLSVSLALVGAWAFVDDLLADGLLMVEFIVIVMYERWGVGVFLVRAVQVQSQCCECVMFIAIAKTRWLQERKIQTNNQCRLCLVTAIPTRLWYFYAAYFIIGPSNAANPQ